MNSRKRSNSFSGNKTPKPVKMAEQKPKASEAEQISKVSIEKTDFENLKKRFEDMEKKVKSSDLLPGGKSYNDIMDYMNEIKTKSEDKVKDIISKQKQLPKGKTSFIMKYRKTGQSFVETKKGIQDFLNDLNKCVTGARNNFSYINNNRNKLKIGKSKKEYHKAKSDFILFCDRIEEKLNSDYLEQNKTKLKTIHDELSRMVNEAEIGQIVSEVKTDEEKLKKYKNNFIFWYRNKVTDNELKRYKPPLADLDAHKKFPDRIISLVNKCKTMKEFEGLIGRWGMSRDVLKKKKIFGIKF